LVDGLLAAFHPLDVGEDLVYVFVAALGPGDLLDCFFTRNVEFGILSEEFKLVIEAIEGSADSGFVNGKRADILDFGSWLEDWILEKVFSERLCVAAVEAAEVVGFETEDSFETPFAGDDFVHDVKLSLIFGLELPGDVIGEGLEEAFFDGIHDGLLGGEAVLEAVHFGDGFTFFGFGAG